MRYVNRRYLNRCERCGYLSLWGTQGCLNCGGYVAFRPMRRRAYRW